MAKATHAQEVATGTAESFTEHELNDPEPHLAILRNRPTLRDEPMKPADIVPEPEVTPEEQQETAEEIAEFETELDPEPEEEPEPQPVKKAPAKKATPRKSAQRKTTDDYDFE